MDKKTIFYLMLNRLPGLGIVGLNKIINKLSPDMDRDELKFNLNSFGFNLITIKDLDAAYENALKTIDLCEKNDISILRGDLLPLCLRGFNDSPNIIFVKGKAAMHADLHVGVIGTRNPTVFGQEATKNIVDYLCKKTSFYVLSGLALGVDSIAHSIAINNNTRTLAILGSGILNIYPKENLGLAHQIEEHGGYILSPFFPSDSVEKYKLIYRDKLQARLSDLMILIESKIDGGSMHAVNESIKLNKSVGVVDYSLANINEDLFAGNTKIIGINNVFKIDLNDINSSLNDKALKNFLFSSVKKNSMKQLF